MSTARQGFEGLGVFYLGREVDPAGGTGAGEPVLYDSRDLVTSQSAPYFTNSQGTPLETPKYEVFAYDPLGRPTQVTHPDTTSATSVYARGVVTLTDERGKVTGTAVGCACGDGVIDWAKVIGICRRGRRDLVLSVECGTVEQAARSVAHLRPLLQA